MANLMQDVGGNSHDVRGGAPHILQPNYASPEPEAWLYDIVHRACTRGRFAEFVVIDVGKAQALLRRNHVNRPVVANALKQWCKALRAGDWAENGESIILSDSGELNDGQHRLMAVVETGIPMPALLVVGVSRESRLTLDSGAKRTAGHVLGMQGVPNGTLVASALKLLLNFEAGTSLSVHRTTPEIERAYALHPLIAEGCTAPDKAARAFRQSTGLFVCLHYQMVRADARRPFGRQAMATAFFQMIKDGVGFDSAAHPVARLRVRLQQDLIGKAKLPTIEVAALVAKSWNAYQANRTIDSLRWRTMGERAEAFPAIQ